MHVEIRLDIVLVWCSRSWSNRSLEETCCNIRRWSIQRRNLTLRIEGACGFFFYKGRCQTIKDTPTIQNNTEKHYSGSNGSVPRI